MQRDIKKANSIVGVDNISNTSSAFLPVRLAGRNVFKLPTITKNDNMIDTIQREKEIVGYDDIYKEGYYIYGWDVEWAYEKNGKPILTPQEIYNSMEKIYEKNRFENIINFVYIFVYLFEFYIPVHC